MSDMSDTEKQFQAGLRDTPLKPQIQILRKTNASRYFCN